MSKIFLCLSLCPHARACTCPSVYPYASVYVERAKSVSRENDACTYKELSVDRRRVSVGLRCSGAC